MPNRAGVPCPGLLSRRHFLKMGVMSLGGLGLANLPLLRAQAKAAGHPGPDTSVILVWLLGGPSHVDTYDLKPDAPSEYRGEFRPIRTNVPGLDLCEHMPLHAKSADKFAIIRSIAHTFSEHGVANRHFLTGREPLVGSGNDFPMVGPMVAKVRQDLRRGVPNYVLEVDTNRQGIMGVVLASGSAYLGPSTHPFMVPGDPSAKGFAVENMSLSPQVRAQLKDRARLLPAVDRLNPAFDVSGTMAALDDNRQRAFDLLTSGVASEAFDLSREPQQLRERYGMHVWGQRALLARRLVEAGASFVTLAWESPYRGVRGVVNAPPKPVDGWYSWDSHDVNCHIFNDLRQRLAYYDRALAALIEDIYARGLDKKVMLIVAGEFGRTPKLTYGPLRVNGVTVPGRDHWPHAMSVLVSGGGLKMGQAVGSTNSKGEHPKDHPLTPNDLWATMFRHLGIDYNNTVFYDRLKRPMPILPCGEPIKELL